MSKVSVVRTNDGVADALKRSLDLIGGLGQFVESSDRVLIKPNLNGADVYTNKELVGTLIEMLRDLGVNQVVIAESTFGNAQMTRMFFNKTGYTELAEKYGVELINLNESEAVEVKVENPLIVESIKVAKEFLEADKIINISNMKVHYATGVSLALKNLKGVLVGNEKRRFHESGLNGAIVDMCNTIKADLNIVDCISCMERMGPHGGEVVDLNLLIAGQNAAEVDHVGCQVMGYDLSEVEHLRKYVEMNGIDLSAVEVVGESIESAKHPLKKVELESIIPQELHIHDTNACSTCMNAFLISCKFLPGKLTQDVNVFLGSLLEDAVVPDGMSLAFGNCCVKSMKADKSIIGCPPYPFALGETLKDILEQG